VGTDYGYTYDAAIQQMIWYKEGFKPYGGNYRAYENADSTFYKCYFNFVFPPVLH
jgi:hypothetical protein